MRSILKLHSDFTCEAVTRIDVELERPRHNRVALRYIVTGTPRDLLLCASAAPERADRLWEHTCFEIFIRAASDESYHEFNFAPSLQWAGYRFESHRSGMTPADIAPPRIETNLDGQSFKLRAAVELSSLPELSPDKPWQLGLSAVIEETSGRKSYWALAHPPGKADFHHPDCFALHLPPAARAS